MRLTYGTSKEKIVGYSDADWAGDKDTRQSTSGYIFSMYGGAISWRSSKKSRIALSSTESEFISVSLSIS